MAGHPSLGKRSYTETLLERRAQELLVVASCAADDACGVHRGAERLQAVAAGPWCRTLHRSATGCGHGCSKWRYARATQQLPPDSWGRSQASRTLSRTCGRVAASLLLMAPSRKIGALHRTTGLDATGLGGSGSVLLEESFPHLIADHYECKVATWPCRPHQPRAADCGCAR